jgi:EAL domain-containing protein (putative c-di-GMP-specific phosphodiesterase class I)
VNVSTCELNQKDMLGMVESALLESDLSPACLEVEMSERVLMGDSERSRTTLHGLRKLGVHLAIDDFGSGFSNMSHLLRLAVDRIKLDRAITQDCVRSPEGAALSSALIHLGQKLNISVIAEGIETVEQARFLMDAGCELGQGYYFSHPAAMDLKAALWGVAPTLKTA